MTRSARAYSTRREWTAPAGYGVDASEPQAGFFKVKLGKDTVACGVEIRFGPPNDPLTGEVLDRSWRWQAILDDGSVADLDRVWPACARTPITEAEYRALVNRREWARQHAPNSAYAVPGRRHDPLSTQSPLPF